LKAEVLRLYYQEHKRIIEIYNILDRHLSYEQIRGIIRRSKPNSAYASLITETKPETKPEKVVVIENLEPKMYEHATSPAVILNKAQTFQFGVASDVHFNSKWVQITALHRFYDILERESFNITYNVGDMDDGEDMRPGHKYDCYNQGADDHCAEIVKNYPRRKNMKTAFITGNHDASIIKRAGYDIGNTIASEREDMIYLGRDCAIVSLAQDCTIELRHPWDGSSYALSYKPQKIIDAMSGGEKPKILLVGHYHKAEQIFYRNIHCFQAGTFCAQTPFMRGKNIAANIGGWLIEVTVDPDGSITRIKSEFIPTYRSIKDDYRNWIRAV